jgi:hypothetical protein
MRRTITALTVAAALAAGPGVPAAHADGGSDYLGGCGYTATSTSNGWDADVRAEVVVYSTVPGDNPVSATVTCEIRVNGVPRHTLAWSGTVVIAGSDSVSFAATGSDLIEVCETVDYTSNGDPSVTTCEEPGTIFDDIDALLDFLAEATKDVDKVVCPVIGLLAPGVPPVGIEPGGDIYLFGDLFLDCYPYQT